MYVDVCTRYMWYRYTQVYHVPPVCCVCVCTTVPTCVVPCTSTIPTVFIIFINYCISHQLFNSHSQLTLTTYTHNFTNVYRTPSVARSTPHTMNDECIAHTCIIYVPPYHTFCTNCLFFGSHFAVDFDLVRCLAARALEMDRSERGLGLRELE